MNLRTTVKLGLICLLALAFTGLTGFAQTEQDLQSQIDELRAELRRMNTNQNSMAAENANLARDNAELRRRLDDSAPVASELESSINVLAEGIEYAPSTTVNSAANPITFTGEFRTRGGYMTNRDFGLDAANDADDDSGTFVDARVNVGITYALSNHVTAHFELLAYGLWDNNFIEGPGGGQLGNVDMYQGWVQIDKLFGVEQLGTKFGRQEIVLGDEFHFGNNSFYAGENHDAALIWWGAENFSLTAILAKMSRDVNPAGGTVAIGHPYPTAGNGPAFEDDEMYALYFTYNGLENHVIDIYWVYFRGEQGGSIGTLGNPLSDGDSDIHALGFRVAGVFDVAAGLDYKAEFTYQTGDLDNLNAEVENFAVEVGLGITFDEENKLRVFIRFYYAEGPDGSEIGYQTPFIDRHNNVDWDDHTAIQARYGIMDIIPLYNVITGQIGFTVNPTENWQVGATFLGAWWDQDVVVGGSDENEIGYELDFFAHYRYSEETTMTFGMGIFLPGDGANSNQLGTADFAGGLGGAAFAGQDDDVAFLLFIQSLTRF